MSDTSSMRDSTQNQDMKIVRVRYYDRLGKVAENGRFAYITFHIGRSEEPEEGDLLVQVTNIRGIPVIVAKYVAGEHSKGFGKPEDLKSLDELEKFGVSETLIEEIRSTCRGKSIDWV